jgi:hypothetical protein
VKKSFRKFLENRLHKKNKSWDGQIKRKIFKLEHKLPAYIWKKENEISPTGGKQSQSNQKTEDTEVKWRTVLFSDNKKSQMVQGHYENAAEQK